jgi:predicted DNA binding CopG/RHH family protein
MTKLPETDSIEELAKFWDSHDLTDFEEQLEEVDDEVFCKNNVIQIEFGPEEMDAIKKIAEEKGIDSPDLIREWVKEKIPAL